MIQTSDQKFGPSTQRILNSCQQFLSDPKIDPNSAIVRQIHSAFAQV